MECFNRCFIFDKSNRVETIFLKKKKKKKKVTFPNDQFPPKRTENF